MSKVAKIKDIEGIDGLILGSGTYHHEIMPALEVFMEQAIKGLAMNKREHGIQYCGCREITGNKDKGHMQMWPFYESLIQKNRTKSTIHIIE
jgi:flavorubredoxin